MSDLHGIFAEFDDRMDKAFEFEGGPWSERAERIIRCPACGSYSAEDEGERTPYGLVCGPCAESAER